MEEQNENELNSIGKKLNQNYFTKFRGAGEGEISVGKKIQLTEDLYSLLFMACIKQEFIDACENKENPILNGAQEYPVDKDKITIEMQKMNGQIDENFNTD